MGEFDIPNFEGAAVFTATLGCTISGNFVFSVDFDRTDKEAMIVTYNVESDDAVSSLWDESGSGPTVIQGDGASVTTPAGFNIHENQWTLSLDVDRVKWTTFDSRWDRTKPGNARVTGSIVGVVEFDAANTQPAPII